MTVDIKNGGAVFKMAEAMSQADTWDWKADYYQSMLDVNREATHSYQYATKVQVEVIAGILSFDKAKKTHKHIRFFYQLQMEKWKLVSQHKLLARIIANRVLDKLAS